MLTENSSSSWILPTVGAFGIATSAIMFKKSNLFYYNKKKGNQKDIKKYKNLIVDNQNPSISITHFQKPQNQVEKFHLNTEYELNLSNNSLVNLDESLISNYFENQQSNTTTGSKNYDQIILKFDLHEKTSCTFVSSQNTIFQQVYIRLMRQYLNKVFTGLNCATDPNVSLSIQNLSADYRIHTWTFSCHIRKSDTFSITRCYRVLWEAILDIRLGKYQKQDIDEALQDILNEITFRENNEYAIICIKALKTDQLRNIAIEKVQTQARKFCLKNQRHVLNIQQNENKNQTNILKQKQSKINTKKNMNNTHFRSLLEEIERMMHMMEKKRTCV